VVRKRDLVIPSNVVVRRDSGLLGCDWSVDGVQCKYPGTISSSTTGTGPWYCTGHFQCSDAEEGRAIWADSERFVPPARNALPKFPSTPSFTKHLDGLDWARAIQARHAGGELVPVRALEMAREVLERRQEPEDVPEEPISD
jgi:hypothetical protein